MNINKTMNRSRPFLLMTKALFVWLLAAWVLGGDLDLQTVGSYRVADIPDEVVMQPGKYAFALGFLFEVSDPANPKPVRRYDTSGWPHGLPVSTNFTYSPDPVETWLVTDRRDPDHPQPLGGYKTIALPFGVRISGKYAYTVDGSVAPGAMEVIDISDPANPHRAGSYQSNHHPNAVAISGNYAYLTTVEGSLDVLDIRNPLKPAMIGNVTVKEEALSVAVVGDYVLVGGFYWLQVVDVRNPANPQPVGRHLQTYDRVGNISVSGNFAYWGGYGDVEFFDISDPAHPRFAGRSDHFEEYTRAVALSGNVAVMTGFYGGLYVMALRPANPQRVADLQFGTDAGDHGPGGLANGLAVAGNHAYVTDNDAGVQVIDISDTDKPRRVGGYGTRGEFNGVAVSSNYAYVNGTVWAGGTKVHDALHVLDVSDPTNLRRVGGASLAGIFSGPVISGNYAYLAGFAPGLDDGLFVFDLSLPTNPRQVGRYHPAGSAGQVAVSGSYAYIPTVGSYRGTNYLGGGSLEVVDVSNPGNLRRVGRYDTFYSARSVAVFGRYACVAIEPDWIGTNRIGGLIVIDISDPQNPRRIGTYGSDLRSDCPSLVVSGDLTYVARGGHGLEVIDLTNPADPRRVGGNSAVFPPNSVSQIAASGGRVFVAAAEQGFVIFDLFRPFRLDPLVGSSPDPFRLRLDGPRGVSVQVQRSTNLADWEHWQPITFGATPVEVSDPDAAAARHRFYRAVIP